MIIGLSEVRRLPRLGKIHLGVKEINAKGVEYPKAVNYFVVPPEVAEVYGEKPTELDIVIPTEDPNIFFPQFYKQYSNKRGLVCLSEDTEILTRHGWVGMDYLIKGDWVITMDIDTGQYHEQRVQDKIVLNYDGFLLNFKTKSLDALLTPDHRVVYRHWLSHWIVKKAIDMPYKGVRWPISSEIQKQNIDISDNLLSLIGWIIADGAMQPPSWGRSHKHIVDYPGNRLTSEERSKRKNYLSVSQAKINYVKEIRKLLKNLFGRVRESIVENKGGPQNRQKKVLPLSRFYLGAKESNILFDWLGKDIHRIPRKILSFASPHQLKIIFDSLVKADGSNDEQHGIRYYVGKNKLLADDFQELCTRLGYKSSINEGCNSCLSTKGQYYVYASKRVNCHLIKKVPLKIPYKGKVWCITVQNGTFVARRNGRVFTTGNCKGDGATANRVEEKEGELIELTCNPDTCEFYLKDDCKPVGNLLFVLPEVKGFGVYQIDTSSIHNIINLNSEIALLKNLLGRISGIPLKLTREVQKLQQKGAIRNIALIHIRSPYSLTELQNGKKALGRPEPVSIEVPDNDVPESVPEEIESAEDNEPNPEINPEPVSEPIMKEPEKEKESAGPIRKIAAVKPPDSKELIKEIYKLLTSRGHTTIPKVIALLEKALPKYSWKKIDDKVFQKMSVENLQKVLDFLNEEDAVYLTPTE